MRVFVRIRLPDEREIELPPDAIIGRMRSATLRLNEPTISEAHALVSLRGSQLKLLALRGRFYVDGVQHAEVALRPGQVIELAPGQTLTVVAVSIPSEVLGLRAHGLPLQVLPPVASIDHTGDLVPRVVPDAAAVLWIDDAKVRVRRAGHPDEWLAAGEAIDVADRTYVVEYMQLQAHGASPTERAPSELPLVMTLFFDSVRITVGERVAAIDGMPARILCELAEINAPVEWRAVAREIWPREDDDFLLRRNWDSGLARLRRALIEQGVRSDLVRAAGRGKVELFLRPGDRVDDQQ